MTTHLLQVSTNPRIMWIHRGHLCGDTGILKRCSGAAEKVNYPFGYGLSYTEFAIEPLRAGEEDGTICVDVRVTNMGSRAGKEVVQLYYRAPQAFWENRLKCWGHLPRQSFWEPGSPRCSD